MEGGEPFPIAVAERVEDWQRLVEKFLRGAREAAKWGESLEGRGEELEPCWPVADVLASLATHNAYHLEKIVALRQVRADAYRISAWQFGIVASDMPE